MSSSGRVTRGRLLAQRATMIAYLRLKLDEQDWHGVADAAMDLRELEVRLALSRPGKGSHA